MLQRLLTAEVFTLMLVFARIGSASILLPGIGENYVSARVRVLLAGAITILVAPVLAPTLPRLPSSLLTMLALIGGEIGIGLFIGTIIRCTMIALEIAGTLISFQVGLQTASIFNPLLSEQSSVTGVLISIAGLVLMFQTDMHHVMLRAVIDSYTLFVPGALPPLGDFTEAVTRTISKTFTLGMQLSAPFLVIALLLNIALGLMSRLMPQLQIFFVALPLQIGLGFMTLVLVLSTILLWWLQNFGEALQMFLAPPPAP